MKSARSFSEHQRQDRSIIKQSANRSFNIKDSEIAYNIFPRQNLNVEVNVHRKCTNQYSVNFGTLAYEKYVGGK